MVVKKLLNINQETINNFKNSFPTLFFKISGMLLSYLVVFFITNKFGATIYGRYAITITIGQLVAVVFTLGFPSLVIKLLNDKDYYDQSIKNTFFKNILKITFLIGLIFSLIFYFFSYYILIQIFEDSNYIFFLKTIAFFFLPIMFHEIFLGYYKGIRDFKKHNIFIFILPSVLFFLFFFLLENIVIDNYVLVLCYGLSISVIFLLEFLFFKRKKIDDKLTKTATLSLVKKAFPMMYSALMLYLLGWTDIFMIESMKSTKEVGIYNAAFKIASICMIFITAINVVIAPKIAALYNQSKFEKLHKIIKSFTRIISILTIPLFIVLYFFGTDILSLFGSEFVEGHLALKVILVGILISALSGNVDQILNMTGNQKLLSKIVLISFALNILLNLILIPKYGINGAAVASLFTNVFTNLSCIYIIKKRLGFYTFM